MKKYILILSTATLFLASCSLHLNLKYNADESGKLSVQMKSENPGMMESMMKQMSKDTSNNEMAGMFKMFKKDSLQDIQGAVLPEIAAGLFGFKNPEIKDIDGGKELSFEFNDISKLNGQNEKRDKSKMFFKNKKNSLTIYFPKKEKKKDDNNQNNPMSGMFSSMIQSELVLEFERKVKRSNYKKIAFSDDNKSAKIRFDITEFEELSGKKIVFYFE